MEVKLDDVVLEVVLVKKNNKNIYLRIKDDLKLYVYANKYVLKKEIEKLILDNKDSIIKMYTKAKKSLDYNNRCYYLGKEYTVVYQNDIKEVILEDDLILVRNEKMLDSFFKKETKRIFNERVEKLKPLFTYLPSFNLKIRNMKTRWGVCNRSKNIVTLNSQLIKKEVDLIDYVIVHEFCHFKEGNHSLKFWEEVAKYYPKYKEARKKLREV